MLVLVNGIPLFSKKLIKQLNAADSLNTYVFVNTYYSILGRIKFALLLPFAKAFISFNGVSTRSGSLDKVLNRKIPMMMFWHGSDALNAVALKNSGNIYMKYIDYSSHFSDAPWLLEELKTILPNSEMLSFKTASFNKIDKPFSCVQILTYVPEGREEFYGLSWIIEWAQSNPDIIINVMGHSGIDQTETKNINFLGWVSEEIAQDYYKNSPIFLRLTQHDGNALSVTQALSFGCLVIWTQPHTHCLTVIGKDEFFIKLDEVLVNKENVLIRKSSVQKFIDTNYNQENVINKFIIKTTDVFSKK